MYLVAPTIHVPTSLREETHLHSTSNNQTETIHSPGKRQLPTHWVAVKELKLNRHNKDIS